MRTAPELDCELRTLIPPHELKNADAAAALLADHIAAGRKLMIVADYDCDGATACAVGLRALSAFGASVDYFVPNRFETGYGLSREVVDLVAPARPDLLITVDNGIASVDGVARARALGIGTLITDHHLPGDELPAAECIVNPSQPGCTFPSKSIAGVGVMFYVMLALRAELRRRGRFEGEAGAEPREPPRPRRARHGRRRRPARPQQPDPREPGRAADARRADAAGDRGALRRRRARPAAGGKLRPRFRA